MNKLQIAINGILKSNPVFVLVLGMCPTLGTTTSASNGMGMGLATMAVLIMSNLVISLIKNLIPDKVRIPAFIVVIASFVTIIQMLMEAFVPALYASLGVFIPLIVVNCIILGRAEAFASKNSPVDSIFDGIGIGLGFTLALTVIDRELPGCSRETLLVLDATTGQNGLIQAKQFKEAAGITGIVLTKLDGTAKGGIAIAIAKELGVPVKYAGVGEGMEDLKPFDAADFAQALI